MLIAEEKKETNIIEYILILYQTEDLLRAYQLDFEIIKEKVILPQIINDSQLSTIESWYKEIIQEMNARGLQKKGHLYRIQEVMMEIVYLHNTLIDIVKDEKYKSLFAAASVNIEDFRKKSDLGTLHPVEVAIQALYMKLLLRLQKKEISAESEEAFDSMRILLAYLSRSYNQFKTGSLGEN